MKNEIPMQPQSDSEIAEEDFESIILTSYNHLGFNPEEASIRTFALTKSYHKQELSKLLSEAEKELPSEKIDALLYALDETSRRYGEQEWGLYIPKHIEEHREVIKNWMRSEASKAILKLKEQHKEWKLAHVKQWSELRQAKDKELDRLKEEVEGLKKENQIFSDGIKSIKNTGINLLELKEKQLQEALEEIASLKIPQEAFCDCKNQRIITTVHPLPNICDHCRKAIK